MLEFDPMTTQYSAANAYFLGRAANLAYSNEATIKDEARKLGLDACVFIEIRETQAFVASNDDMVVVSFRGTEVTKLQDMLTDAEFALVDGPFGKVHSGFQRGLGRVWDSVLGEVKRCQRRGQSLWFTGHSLGAALAMLAAGDCIEMDKPVNGVYTFGQPRVGDKIFARLFD